MSKHTVLTLLILRCYICPFSECSRKDIFIQCKFPNEGCGDNNECCSGKCVEAHPGTNARCTKVSLHKPCLYTYQCEDRLRCAKRYTCCAKYWGICSHARDCCDPLHRCLGIDGFYYKRCLYSNVQGHARSRWERYNILTICASFVTVLIVRLI